MNTCKQLLNLAITAIAFSGSAYASDAIDPGDNDSRWIVGASVVSLTNPYVGESNETYLVPSLIYNGERFFFKNGVAGLSVLQRGKFSGGFLLNPDGSLLYDEDEYDDNPRLAGIKERDGTLEGGFYINHTSDLGRLNVSVLTDLGNDHDGQTVTMRYIFDYKAGQWNINPVVGVSWISDDKVDHHYGVRANEATAVRAVYKADSAVNVFAGIRGRYEFNDHWDLNLEAGVTRLDSAIKDSPIVEEDNIAFSKISVRYSF